MDELPEKRARQEDSAPAESLADEEAEAAAAEAGRIGGEIPPDSDDPSEQPLVEAGEGEQEGFELAERDLEETASHGGAHGFPQEDLRPPEEQENAVHGESDQETPPDGPEGGAS